MAGVGPRRRMLVSRERYAAGRKLHTAGQEMQTATHDALSVTTQRFDASQYPRTYRFSTGYRIFMIFTGAVNVALGCLAIFAFVTGREMDGPGERVGFGLLGALFLWVGLYVTALTLKTKVILYPDRIEHYCRENRPQPAPRRDRGRARPVDEILFDAGAEAAEARAEAVAHHLDDEKGPGLRRLANDPAAP